MRTMYDSVNVQAIPADATLVAGYVSGTYANIDKLRQRFPHATVVSITTNAAHDAQVLDVEPRAATMAQAVSWVIRQRARGADPTVYTMHSWWSDLRKLFAAAHEAEPHWWVAKYDNNPALLDGAVAKQYGGQNGYDLSAVADYWPGIDATPSHYTGDSLLMSAALNDDDARRCLLRQWFDTYLGRSFTDAHEQQLHLLNFAKVGADLELAGIMDSPEAKAYRTRTPDAR